jgi:hypothetical protein
MLLGFATWVSRMASDLPLVRLPVGNDWEHFCAVAVWA